VPFAGADHLEIVEKKDRGEFVPASKLNPGVPPALDRILNKMLARHPRDRYQTASELIVDLDRSGLGVVVPSFADPNLARQDPWVQACLTANVQPTRPDLTSPVRQEAKTNGRAGIWYLRYCDRKGTMRVVRATTAQIVQRLRQDRLPAKAELAMQADGLFRSPAEYADFRSIKPERVRRRPKRIEPQVDVVTPLPDGGLAPQSALGRPTGWRKRWWLLVAAGVGGGVVTVVLASYLFFVLWK